MRLWKIITIMLLALLMSFLLLKSMGKQEVEAVANADLHFGKVWALPHPSLFQLTYTPTPSQTKDVINQMVRNGALKPVTISHILKNAKHTLYWKNNLHCQKASKAIQHLSSTQKMGGYCWPQKDQQGFTHTGMGQWFPQSISFISHFGDFHGKALAVGWYKKGIFGSQGTRLSLIQAPESNGTNLKYANILFASISGTPGHLSVNSVNLHAGGFGWYQNHLFMADTDNGLRVFNLNHIYKVSTGKNMLGLDLSTGKFYARNYQYIIFQSGRYTRKLQGLGDSRLCSREPSAIGHDYCFSTLSVDRTSHPASLITAEYRQAGAMRADYRAGEPMRIVRWPLNSNTGLLATGQHGLVTSNHAYGTWTKRVQGVFSHNGVFYLASSLGSFHGTLYKSRLGGKTKAREWSIGPEDLSLQRVKNRLWSLTEHVGKRMLFWVKRSR